MGKSAPKSPDPKETAAAQTASNIGTAVANSYLGNVNQVTPDGSLTYAQSGTTKWTDPLSNKVYDIPTWTATQTLSEQQQAIKNQGDRAELNLATLAADQSGRLSDLLGTPFNLNGAPAAADPSKLTAPQYQQFGAGPQLQTSVGAGRIQNSIANAGNIQSGLGNAGKIQTALGDAGNVTRSYDVDFDTSRYEDALMQRMNPQLAQNREALETRLTNQGLQPGSEAYNRAIDAASRQENDARYGAILNAGQEQSRLAGLAANQASFQNSAQQQAYNQLLGSGQFANQAQAQRFSQNLASGQFANSAQAQQYSQNANNAEFANSAQNQAFQQGMANATLGNSANQQMHQNQTSATAGNNALQDQNFNAQQAIMNAQNQARSNYLNEQYALRNQPINEISALLSGGQVTAPSFVPTQGQQIANVDYAGLVNQNYQNQMAAYQQSQANGGALLGGLAGLFSLSDKTAKKDIKKVGSLDGHGLYRYRYKGKHDDGREHIGVIAQDVQKKRPDAVARRPDGKLAVNYGALFNAGA